MQLKSILSGLVAAVLVFGMMASTAEAQINIQLFPNGSSNEVASNQMALTNDRGSIGAGLVISGGLLASSPLTSTTLTISYGVPITSSIAIPAGDVLRLVGATGVFAAASIITVNFVSGSVAIGLPGFANVSNTLSGSVRLVGVRVNPVGKTAPIQASASLSNTANNYLLSTSTPVTVITALNPGIATLAIGSRTGVVNTGTGAIFTNAVIGDGTSSLVITEGFASAWRSATQESNSGVALGGTGAAVELTFTGIPAGVSLAITVPSSPTTLGTVGISDATLTSASGDNDVTFTFTASSLTAVESFQVNVVATIGGTTTSVAAGTIAVSANLNPLGAALSAVAGAINTPTATGGYPRFAVAATSAVTVYSIFAARTNLLVPYLVSDGTFDTGIVITNTTADPWSGSGGAAAGAGTVTFYFYPRTATGVGTSWTLTTGTGVTPGVGFATDGTLVSGGTASVLLSQLMTAANQTGPFTGYVFIQTNFILAHGISFVSDFKGPFTSFSPMLTVPQTQTTARTGFESLSF